MARVENSREVLQIASQLPKPVFLMGDLNCNITTDAYKELLNNQFADAKAVAAKTVDCNTHHPYPDYDEGTDCFFDAPIPTDGYERAIDHLLVDVEDSANDCQR